MTPVRSRALAVQEVDQLRNDLSRSLFHQPMPGSRHHDAFGVGVHELALVDQDFPPAFSQESTSIGIVSGVFANCAKSFASYSNARKVSIPALMWPGFAYSFAITCDRLPGWTSTRPPRSRSRNDRGRCARGRSPERAASCRRNGHARGRAAARPSSSRPRREGTRPSERCASLRPGILALPCNTKTPRNAAPRASQ